MTRTSMFVFALAISVCIAPANQNATQANNPSLAETIAFLKDKTENISEIGSGLFERFANPSAWKLDNPAKCTLVWSTEKQIIRFDRRDVLNGKTKNLGAVPVSVTVSLSDFDPKTIAGTDGRMDGGPPDPPSIYLPIAGERKLIKWQNGQDRSELSSVFLKFSDGAMAVRYGKALRHAIELCGGKPYQNKEPF